MQKIKWRIFLGNAGLTQMAVSFTKIWRQKIINKIGLPISGNGYSLSNVLYYIYFANSKFKIRFKIRFEFM